MGDIADQIIDQMMWGSRPARGRKRTFQSGSGDFMWRTQTGEVVPMHDMTTSHLKNALRVCEVKSNSGKAAQLRAVIESRKHPLRANETRKDLDPTPVGSVEPSEIKK